ncbi:MAG: hypothetical protein JWQ96_1619 [Segetibacter sp.]|nr:hypothetical protein [Segetibacter sp.]
MQLLIYTTQASPRVEYIFSTLLPALGITDYQITTDLNTFKNFSGAKINYSFEQVENTYSIQPASLLFENEIKQQQIDCFDWNGYKAFFKTGGDLPFDIFAASFYLLSRYEEYLPHQLDMYGRFAHENSLAFKEGFLQFPLINLWLQKLGKSLKQKFPSLLLQPADFRFIPTYDIDIAWSYKHKGVVRNVGGLVKSIMKGEWANAIERMKVLQGASDPFDSYKWLDEVHKNLTEKPLYFFLLAQQNKGYDKNILPTKPELQALVKEVSTKYNVGIHPSWQSGDDSKLLNEEVILLENITSRSIIKSRQHYIRMMLPTTYRQLIQAGITEDYSMGFGSINGFRASYCLPYKWYDLEKEETTNLTLFPFCYMEANSFYEQHYSTAQASTELEHYYNITKSVGGLLITIWHNHFLGTDRMFAGWKEVYEKFLQKFVRR